MMTGKAREFYWMVKREIWECRSFYIVPIVILGIITVTEVVALIRGNEHLGLARAGMMFADNLSPAAMRMGMEMAFMGIGTAFAGAMTIVAAFYLLDSLYAERRDRSVLFWKSLPISDTETVLAKFFTGVVVVPAIAVASTLCAYLLTLIIGSLIFGFTEGFPLGTLWNPLNIASATLKSFLLTYLTQLWYLPLLAWLLLCSAFARKTPILFAIFIPAAIVLAENLVMSRSFLGEAIMSYHKNYVGMFVRKIKKMEASGRDFFDGGMGNDGITLDLISPLQVFGQPAFYVGLVIAISFIAGAIWLRRNRIDFG